MRPIDADGLEIDMAEEVFDGDGGYKIFGYSKRQIDAAPTIAPQPNDPLTLEELRGMDGEPVWIVPMRGSGGFCTWMLVDAEYELCREAHGEMAVFENCGKTWLAYRRKPKELEGGIEVC